MTKSEYDVVLDFSGDFIEDDEKLRLIRAISEGKKVKTKLHYWGDGNYNSLNTPGFEIIFDTNTLIGFTNDMGLKPDCEEMSQEEIDEILEGLEYGPDNLFNQFMEESKNDFVD